MTNDPKLTESYDYTLPPELIATEAAEPRDSARLMVIDRRSGEIHHTRFSEILDFLPPECGVIYNDTKVIKARLFGRKESGGRVELLINKPLNAATYHVLIRGRVKEGTRLRFAEDLVAEVAACLPDGSRKVRFYDGNGSLLAFEALLPKLERYGHVERPVQSLAFRHPPQISAIIGRPTTYLRAFVHRNPVPNKPPRFRGCKATCLLTYYRNRAYM